MSRHHLHEMQFRRLERGRRLTTRQAAGAGEPSRWRTGVMSRLLFTSGVASVAGIAVLAAPFTETAS